jgi:ribosomal protein S18 acetylase RimI-like enzyme
VRLKGATVRALDAIARRRAPKLADGAVRIEPLGIGDVGSAVELVTRALRADAGDRGEQFVCDIAGEPRQMFVAKMGDQVIAYGRVVKLAADEAARGAPAGYYVSGVLVDPVWRRRGIGAALTRAGLDWVFAPADEVFYVTGEDNLASLRLHAVLGFHEMKRLVSERSAGRGCAVAAYQGGLPRRRRVRAASERWSTGASRESQARYGRGCLAGSGSPRWRTLRNGVGLRQGSASGPPRHGSEAWVQGRGKGAYLPGGVTVAGGGAA